MPTRSRHETFDETFTVSMLSPPELPVDGLLARYSIDPCHLATAQATKRVTEQPQLGVYSDPLPCCIFTSGAQSLGFFADVLKAHPSCPSTRIFDAMVRRLLLRFHPRFRSL